MLKVMKNSKKLLKESEVQLSDLGLYLKLISMEYPGVESAEELADLISKEFNVICTALDVKGYHQVCVHEDYELESRRHEHGLSF